MVVVYRIYERTENEIQVLTEVRNGTVTGCSAASIHKLLEQHAFPYAPIEDVIDQLLLLHPGIGAAIVPSVN